MPLLPHQGSLLSAATQKPMRGSDAAGFPQLTDERPDLQQWQHQLAVRRDEVEQWRLDGRRAACGARLHGLWHVHTHAWNGDGDHRVRGRRRWWRRYLCFRWLYLYLPWWWLRWVFEKASNCGTDWCVASCDGWCGRQWRRC